MSKFFLQQNWNTFLMSKIFLLQNCCKASRDIYMGIIWESSFWRIIHCYSLYIAHMNNVFLQLWIPQSGLKIRYEYLAPKQLFLLDIPGFRVPAFLSIPPTFQPHPIRSHSTNCFHIRAIKMLALWVSVGLVMYCREHGTIDNLFGTGYDGRWEAPGGHIHEHWLSHLVLLDHSDCPFVSVV